MSPRFPALSRAALALLLGAALPALGRAGEPAPLATLTVAAAAAPALGRHDGTVEAVRQTVVAAQVAGAVVALPVRAGDRVRAGQVLARLDARAAEQQAGAAAAQVEAARAAQQAATLEMQRQRQLFASRFISQAALDQAEARFRAASAQAEAQRAAAQAARTESGHFVVRAPYDAVVAEVNVMPGDMALPGRALVTLFDPTALRLAVAVPESDAAALRGRLAMPVTVEIAGRRLSAAPWEVLPAADPATHTVTVRIPLPAGSGAAPGGFARAWLPAGQDGAEAMPRLFVPSGALVQRAELRGVYVVGADGRALLRQVRTGPAGAERTEVLAGLRAGERIALDPQAAATATTRRP